MGKINEKLLTFSDDEMGELKQFVHDHFDSLKQEYKPALDLVQHDAVERHVNKFLLEKKAAYLLDAQAQKEGHESYAHKVAAEEKARAEKEAEEKAKQDAIDAAKKVEEDRILQEEVERQRVLKDARDKEDAEAAALLRAKLRSESLGKEQAKV